MEIKTLEKNGKKVEYFIDQDNYVVVRDPETKEVIRKAPVDKEAGNINTEGVDEFHTCMAGCYGLDEGSPWKLAACIAECSTLIPT